MLSVEGENLLLYKIQGGSEVDQVIKLILFIINKWLEFKLHQKIIILNQLMSILS